MDLNYVLNWFVCLSCVVSLLRIVRSKSVSTSIGWIAVLAFTLVTTLLLIFLMPEISGYTGSAFFLLLVVAPSILAQRMQRFVMKQEFSRARKIAELIGILHPADGWREFPEIIRSLELGQRGEFASASAILQRHQASKTPVGRTAVAQLFRMNNRWKELAEWIETNISEKEMTANPDMIIQYVRALGETGNVNRLLLSYEKYRKNLHVTQIPVWRDLFYLQVFSFCGKREPVDRILQRGPLASYPEPVHHFWKATAEQAAGNNTAAEEHLRLMEGADDFWIRLSLQQRRSGALANVNQTGVLTPQGRSILESAEKEFEQEERYGKILELRRRKPIVTYGLIGINVLCFVIEIVYGGSENYTTLFRLGALHPELVAHGQWIRILLSLFLHFGPIHLILNMLALFILGPYVEVTLGRFRFLLLYAVAGVGSMLMIVILALGGAIASSLTVGASGAIMGLIGATAAILLRGWRQEGAAAAKRRLVPIAFILVLQTAFDLWTPQISFVGHFSGAALGFLCASLLH